ncbi:membrane-associated protein, putative [Bodo saltans]|uniref:Membrane-associated protein, putative n=1 Tax=Bodo saltans TaxID=75058 RepID=A0A0S4JJ35_BODSA|nr:membrane-associated protein, putative [Bodo saltans]|eukprot:CUG90191.1 membrane-associated protein, putative [Bodo saltans]
MDWRPFTSLHIALFVILSAAPTLVTPQRTTGPSSDTNELSCTATTYPCLRTRYIDLVLDFAKLDDFDLSAAQPRTSPWEAARSSYSDAIQGDQTYLPFLRALCFSTVSTFSPVVSSSATASSSTTNLETLDAGMTGVVRSFPEYQEFFASQFKLPVSTAAYPTPTTSAPTTTEVPVSTSAPGGDTTSIAPPPTSTVATSGSSTSSPSSNSTTTGLSSTSISPSPTPTGITTGAARQWRDLAAASETDEYKATHNFGDENHESPGSRDAYAYRRAFGLPLADSTTTSTPSTTTPPSSTQRSVAGSTTTTTPGATSSSSSGGPSTSSSSPSSTSSPPLTSTPAPPPSDLTAGSPVTQPICTPVQYSTIIQGMTGPSFPNATALDIAVNGVVTSASLVATPGVRLLPFRSAGGHVVIPFGGSPSTVAAGARAQQRQYLVTLAVTTTGARAKALFSVLQSFSVRPRTNADGSPSSTPAAAATNDNILYKLCGLFDVIWLTTDDYESLYFNTNAGSRPSLFAAVGFGQAPSDGLTLPWILLLVIGTCLAALVLYAFCIRRQADANRKDAEGAADEEGGKSGGGGLDDGERSDEDVDDDYEQELQATEAEQLIQQNIRSVWQEKDLKSELRGAVLRKLVAEQEILAAEQLKLQGLPGGGGNRSPTSTSDNGSGASGSDTDANPNKRGKRTGAAVVAPENAIATRLTADGTKLIVLQPLHESYQGSTQHVVPRRSGGKGANVSRTQLLPNSSYFEEMLELSAEYNLPPDSQIMKDEAALSAYLRTKREERRRRDDDLGVGLNPGGVVRLPGQELESGAGRKSGSRAGSNGQSPTSENFDDFANIMSLPPAAVEIPAAEREELEKRRAADDAAALAAAQDADSPNATGGRVQSKPMGLAARRMANMMSNMRFAAVPSGVLRLPSRHEMIGQLSGGSASSHLAMAGAPDDTTDRLMRQRFSKLYFAPQALVDQPADDSDDSAPSSPSLSPRARRAVPELRFQDITRNLNNSNGGDYSPTSASPSQRGGGGGSASSPPNLASSPPQLPVQEGGRAAGVAATPTSSTSRASPSAFRVEL